MRKNCNLVINIIIIFYTSMNIFNILTVLSNKLFNQFLFILNWKY